MLSLSYMPGCTLKTAGRNFERATLEVLELLGVSVTELENWYCCGTTYSLASDNLMNHLAPARTLLRAKESGREELLVLCSMCYNTLRRAQDLMLSDGEKRGKINEFLDIGKTDLIGNEVKVVHLSSYLQEHVGFEKLAQKCVKKIDGLKLAVYYGCMLLRPREVAIDRFSENPSIMEELFGACGAACVYFPHKAECCGSYRVVDDRTVVEARAEEIVSSAAKNGADLIVTSCPLCYYNLDGHQGSAAASRPSSKAMPVMYMSEVLALFMGAGSQIDYALHAVDPRPVLRQKGLL